MSQIVANKASKKFSSSHSKEQQPSTGITGKRKCESHTTIELSPPLSGIFGFCNVAHLIIHQQTFNQRLTTTFN